MIKIVDLPEEEIRKKVWFKPPFFIIDGDDFFIKHVPPEPYPDCYGGIGIYDKEGRAFEIHDKPTVTPLALATGLHFFIRKSFFKDRNGNTFGSENAHNDDYARSILGDDVLESIDACPKEFPRSCVDPRIIMARILGVWAGTAIFEEGIFHLPTLEEAEEWLELNRFTGPNRKGEDGYPGYYIWGNERLQNVPRAIQEFHDENQRESEEEEEQF